MIVVNDFFKRRKEAVSNQMELISKSSNGKIISATRFMNQKPLQQEELKDNIYVYTPFKYPFMLRKHLKNSNDSIYLFEEEPSIYKRILFNKSKKNLYISLYRMPSTKECNHLKKFKYLKDIFVELDIHKKKLIECGIDKNIIHITPTPTKFKRKENKKKYNPKNVEILFASWNMSEGKPLYDRGLIYLLDMLVKNKNLNLTVILRDNNTSEFITEIKNRKLDNKVKLINPKTDDELEKIYEKVDFVAFPAQKRIVKDVPNSLIDGLCKGKPIIITDILNFSETVKKENIGIVTNINKKVINLDISCDNYEKMSKNAYKYSQIHSQENYIKTIMEVIDNENSNFNTMVN